MEDRLEKFRLQYEAAVASIKLEPEDLPIVEAMVELISQPAHRFMTGIAMTRGADRAMSITAVAFIRATMSAVQARQDVLEGR